MAKGNAKGFKKPEKEKTFSCKKGIATTREKIPEHNESINGNKKLEINWRADRKFENFIFPC